MRWVRAKDGAVFGVCKGVAKALDLPVGVVRLCWLVSVLLGGVGLGAYLMLAICLPREDKVDQAMQPRVLGVCARLSRRTELDVGLVRFLALGLLFVSLGMTAVFYMVVHLLLPDQSDSDASRNNPSSPPSTM